MSAAPHPAAVTMIVSSPDASNASIFRRASSPRLFHHAAVDLQRAAALLLDRNIDGEPLCAITRPAAPIHIGKDRAHDAAVEQHGTLPNCSRCPGFGSRAEAAWT